MRGSLAALVVVLTAAAFLSAAWDDRARQWIEGLVSMGTQRPSSVLMVTAGTLLGLLMLPLILVTLAATFSRRGGELWQANLQRYALAFVPLGLGMWGAHYTYHWLDRRGHAGDRRLAHCVGPGPDAHGH